jgi:hypothetical protein
MTTAAEERNGASDVTRARENPPSRKPAEHYWGILVNANILKLKGDFTKRGDFRVRVTQDTVELENLWKATGL